ncbi:hypothetical protein G7Z17_g3131 [Cylindrodendrum hubeiense]|uniref:DUF7779 domain-containing protein n=1 Tax=Cylindrodendrum hubeiense TaxID=595255 RepID=A0A9P5LDU3_9HYPO|nr:hypothetical protein G7Z17_g3131 [Cylindrodendrum hubeiense]
MEKTAVEIENQKNTAEKQFATSNSVLYTKLDKDTRDLAAQMAVKSNSKLAVSLRCGVTPYSANSRFHRWQQILDRVKAQLIASRNQRSSVATSGLGGMEQPQFALNYVCEYLDKYPVALRMQDVTHNDVTESYINPAKCLQLEPEDSAPLWNFSIASLSANALKLLRIISCFSPDGIPERLFWEGSKNSSDDLLEFLQFGHPYFSAVQELISHGLLTKTQRGTMTGYSTTEIHSLAIHRLVRGLVFHQMSSVEKSQLLDDALELLLSAWPVNHEQPFCMTALWPVCSLYLPHVLALESRCHDVPFLKTLTRFVALFFYASWYLTERSMSELAFPLLKTARSIAAQGGDVDPFLAKLLIAYGTVCLECDRQDESKKWISQAIDIQCARVEELINKGIHVV